MKINNPGNFYTGMGGNGNQKPIPEHLYFLAARSTGLFVVTVITEKNVNPVNELQNH